MANLSLGKCALRMPRPFHGRFPQTSLEVAICKKADCAFPELDVHAHSIFWVCALACLFGLRVSPKTSAIVCIWIA